MNDLQDWLVEKNKKTYIQGYSEGYRDGYEDMKKRILFELWDHHKKVLAIDSELAETIQMTIETIEKQK